MTTDRYRQFRSFPFIAAPLLLFVIFLSPGVVAAKSLARGSWKIVASPSPSASSSYLNGAAAISTGNVWAVGDVGGNNGKVSTLIEHWNGTKWSVVPSPSTNAMENILNSVAVISANNVWAVGYTNDGKGLFQTLIEHWDGKHWSIVPSPDAGSSENALNSVTATSARDVWAVGYYYNTSSGPSSSLIEHWNGTQWSIVSSPNASSSSILFGIARVPKTQKMWTVGSNNSFQTFTEFYTP